MMPGSKGLSPHELAHKWAKGLGTRPDMSIKAVRKRRDMRMAGRIARAHSAKQSVGISHHYLINSTRRQDVGEII